MKQLTRFSIGSQWMTLLNLFLLFSFLSATVTQNDDTCASNTARIVPTESSPPQTYLKLMEYDIGNGTARQWIYVEPPVQSFYRNIADNSTNDTMLSSFSGRHCKFFNLLTGYSVDLFWRKAASLDSSSGESKFVRTLKPSSTSGVTAFLGDVFTAMSKSNPPIVLETFVVSADGSNLFAIDSSRELLIREASPSSPPAPSNLPSSLQRRGEESQELLRQTLAFGEQYFRLTQRPYLSRYGRKPPVHWMWPAEFFGQKHSLESTHVQYSRGDELQPSSLNLTLTVLSCAPRVFEIPNFLSNDEVIELVEISKAKKLYESETGGVKNTAGSPVVTKRQTEATTGTRTSRNAWVSRRESPIVETIYRRAFDLMQMTSEPAEALQLVRYGVGEEYKAHYDFGFPDPTHPDQPTRFATLILYLNDVPQGGETTFPRWSNAMTDQGLSIKPEAGKAILFYLMTPDGNMDELSVHAAEPVLEGEKLMANLWFWDPYLDIESLK